MDCNTPGIPYFQTLSEFVQTDVHWVNYATPISSSSVALFSSCPQSFPASGSFKWVGSWHQVARVLELQLQHQFSKCHMSTYDIQGWFPLRLMGLIFMLSKGLSRVFSSTTVRKYQLLAAQTSLWRNYHIHTWLLEKNIVLIRWTFVNKVMSLILNMLSKFVIAFLPRGKCLLISWLQSPSAVILEPNKIKPIIVSIFSPSIWYEVMGPKATILVFWMLSFKPSFFILLFHPQEAL